MFKNISYIDSDKDEEYYRRCAYLESSHNNPVYDGNLPHNIHEGTLWIKDTNDFFVYQCQKWNKVPKTFNTYFNFNEIETDGLNEVVTRTFIFPDYYKHWYPCISTLTCSTRWSQQVVDPVVDGKAVPYTESNGMIITLRDKADKQVVIQTQVLPTTYQLFTTVCCNDYIPNPGDVLEIVIQKPPNVSPTGEGVLFDICLEISPFTSKHHHKNKNYE